MKFSDSALAHALLDGTYGIEIGGSAHNAFNIPYCRNVDYTDDMNTVFKQEETKLCGQAMPVDFVAPAWDLPFEDESQDYVLSSHVIEHCFDPLSTIEEWFRVLAPGGFIFMIVPHKERTFDSERPRTTYDELKQRQSGIIPAPAFDTHEHYSVWITEDWLEICEKEGWHVLFSEDVDSKVGNGFTVVMQKT